jgi:carbon storage regulator CsrA
MLILTRKRDESIRIGEDIVLHVMRTSKGSVKIGIEAPASIRIARGELHCVAAGADSTVDVTAEVCSADALLLHH